MSFTHCCFPLVILVFLTAISASAKENRRSPPALFAFIVSGAMPGRAGGNLVDNPLIEAPLNESGVTKGSALLASDEQMQVESLLVTLPALTGRCSEFLLDQ
jgi:hypothetical protein